MKTNKEIIKKFAFDYVKKIEKEHGILKPKEARCVMIGFLAGFYECEDVVNKTLDKIEKSN